MAEHLLDDIAIALTLAFAGGLSARLLGLPTIPGFLLAGIAISPFTPGYVADAAGLRFLAEIGVVFLMFGVGLHFKLDHLGGVRGVVVPGALLQMAVTTAVASALGTALGLEVRAALVLGVAAAVASTVVLTRTLDERALLDSEAGHIAIGWLVVQDLAMVLVLALIPSLGQAETSLTGVALATARAAIFLAVTLIAGARTIPWLLRFVAATGSRELFILAVVSTALAIAASASALGMSVALGAFIAGLAISEADTSRAAAEEVLPLREAFAALFFVSVGMLLDPAVLLANIRLVMATLALICVNSAIALAILWGAPRWRHSGPVVAAGLAQIGEFSFIIAEVGRHVGVLEAGPYNAILGASVVSILLNPLAFRVLRAGRATEPVPAAA